MGHITQHIPEEGGVQLLAQEPLSRGQRGLLLPLLLLPPAQGPGSGRRAEGASQRRGTPQQGRAEGRRESRSSRARRQRTAAS